MTQRQLENNKRLEFLRRIEDMLTTDGEEVLRVSGIKSASRENYGLMIPTLDDNQDEMTIRIEVSCVRSSVDPYEAAEEYKQIIDELDEKNKTSQK